MPLHFELFFVSFQRVVQFQFAPLLPRFPSIVVLAQHLAVGRVGFSPLVPGLDVIAFHFVQLEFLLALYADSLLPLIRFALHVIGERADASPGIAWSSTLSRVMLQHPSRQ